MPETNKTIRILIADDHPIFRDGLRRLLEAEPGLQVVGEATDGNDAIRLAQELKPDILLLDLAMPHCPGLEALQGITKTDNPMRTILLTAAIDKAQIVEALQLGARGIVMKESATQLLLTSIRTVMGDHYWVGREMVADMAQYLRTLVPPGEPRKGRPYGLTNREVDIVSSIVDGCTNKEIARKFSLSEDTVKHHLTNIFDKLGVGNRLELALFAINNRLLDRS